MADPVFECDACGHEVSGYSKKELLEDGWKFHDAKKKRTFVMCGDCEREYQRRREVRAAGCACRHGEECFICAGKGNE